MIFSNTTPLFAFAALKNFDLLNLVHGEIHVAAEVVRECEAGGPVAVPSLHQIAWVKIHQSPPVPDSRFFMLDAGERDTISAALKAKAELVIIDERLGRNLAEYHGLKVIGTLGTLLKAKERNLISNFLPAVRQLQDAGFWFNERLVHRLAALVNEA